MDEGRQQQLHNTVHAGIAALAIPYQGATSPAPILEARAVSYAVNGKTLIDQVSLVSQPGEVLVIVGPNGAGKTTLLNLLTGDLRPDQGEVLLDGVALRQISNRAQARQRAVMRQRFSISFPFTAMEVVLMGRYPHLQRQRECNDDVTIARQALACTQALPFETRTFPTLSGGEQTLVSLARVLAQTTPILLLDEPTAALDLRHQHAILRLARAVAAAGGSVLAILHDLNLAAAYADRIGLLSNGQLVALGTPWDVLDARHLADVYQVQVVVQAHPTLATPLVLVLPEAEG